ncbi:MAG: proline--tRNA ligase [Deltaproteobacteria bacterium]|nr:proline--tRNA ligase [Deltaproteobacteria bacterium]
MASENAISPTRSEDYPEWYQQVVRAADLAETSAVRGCMVIKPWGYGIWENIQRKLDNRIKETGHQNAYFPLFIPLSFFEKEAEHVEGFAKECAVVTHHRLEQKEGRLIPAAPLEEPLVVRPTSETIIGASFAKWIQSYRDLPLLINQWANVVRWEMRPRVFLRTAEFLWQEGHTAHATREEALRETMLMHEVYREFMEEVLAMPVIPGEKTAGERFPGAVSTFSVEAMMQDRKALQAGTSHYLGQNFAKSSDIKFVNEAGDFDFVHTTSWGVSTRLIGGVIMTHGDDDGLKVPPKVAPYHVVILPVIPKPEAAGEVREYAEKLREMLRESSFDGERLSVHIDNRDMRGGEKNWEWIKKGAPIRLEVGPRDIKSESAMLYRRDKGHKDKASVNLNELKNRIAGVLSEIQANYLDTARQYLKQHTSTEIRNFDELKSYFTPKKLEKPEIHGGFVLGKWCNDQAEEKRLNDLKITIRCLPLQQSGTSGKCIVTGREATVDAIFAKAY